MAPSPSHPAPSTLTPVRRRSSLDLSLTGLVYILMMLFMGLAAVNSQANPLFGVFGLMVGILLISGIISRKVIRRLDIRRALPDHAVVGQKATLTYQVRNTRRFWPSLSVTIAELDGAEGFARQPQAYLLHVAPRATVAVSTEVLPKRRGLYQFDRHQLISSFPFGFIRRAITVRHPDRMLVYPAVAQVDPVVLSLCQAAERTGPSVRPRRGGTDEFYGVKEHRPGDNPRLIHWKRSARTAPFGVLVAKELTQVAPPRLLLVVDTFAADRSPGRLALVERTIATAGSLAARALDEDVTVGLFAWAGGWKGIDPMRGKRHRNDLLSVLARLPLNTDHGAAELLANSSRFLKAGTTAVLLTPDDRPAGPEVSGRGTTLVIPSASAAAASWFRFDEIDFAACIPADQLTR